MHIRIAIEKEGDRHAHDLGHLIEPSGGKGIGAILVFLNLLKTHPKLVAQSLLAKPHRLAPPAQTLTDVYVEGGQIGRAFLPLSLRIKIQRQSHLP